MKEYRWSITLYGTASDPPYNWGVEVCVNNNEVLEMIDFKTKEEAEEHARAFELKPEWRVKE